MRVLFVSKTPPTDFGGSETRLLQIGKRLVVKGHTVMVVCGKSKAGLPDYDEREGLRLYYVKTVPDFLFRFEKVSYYLSKYLFPFTSLGRIYQVANFGADVIVDDVAPYPTFAYLVGLALRIPVYAAVHEFLGTRWFRRNDPLTAAFGFIAQFLLKTFQYEGVITVSRYTKARLESFGLNPARIFVIPSGVNGPLVSQPNRPAGKEATLVCLGRLVKQKGHIYLVQAMNTIVREVPQAKLNIIGDGPLRGFLQAKVREYRLDSRVILWGAVSEEQKLDILCGSRVFVMPSVEEGLGLAIIEAMACGLPVVANNLPAFREIMGENSGYLVDIRNEGEFVKAIVDLLTNEEKSRAIGEYNREHARRFAWDRFADMEEKVLIGGNGGRKPPLEKER